MTAGRWLPPGFTYREGALFCEEASVAEIAARHGTPCYAYSRRALMDRYAEYHTALEPWPHLICYAVKANSNLALLQILARLGAGFDVVSGGEIARVLRAGGDPARIVFAGVGKRAEEIHLGLSVGIRCFNVESEAELRRIDQIAAERGVTAPVSLRINPDVDAITHPKISTGLKKNKFGIPWALALPTARLAATLPHVELLGAGVHIGSQLMTVAPFRDALARALDLVRTLRSEGIPLRQVDAGGGLGIRYRDERPPTVAEYGALIVATLAAGEAEGLEILVEPGRSLVGNAGILVARVEYVKPTPERNFLIVDAAMNDLVRPAMYDAYHEVIPVRDTGAAHRTFDVVGPVCESGDVFGRGRLLAAAEGDLLAFLSAGAYGFSMASHYNSRPLPCEVLVDGTQIHEIRERDRVEDLYAHEHLLPE